MATKFEKPLEASQVTPVADMPPLEVVTQGIPAQEQIEAPPTAQAQAAPVAPERPGHTLAWALAGAIGFLLVVAGIFALTQYSPTSTPDLHMGLTPQAWQEFRAGERASTTPVHMGLTLPAWQEFRAGERAVAPVLTHMGSHPGGLAGLPNGRTGGMTQAPAWLRVTPARTEAPRSDVSTRRRWPSGRCVRPTEGRPGRRPSAGAG